MFGKALGIQKEAAILMDELVNPVATKWQQIGNRSEESPHSKPNLTAYVAAPDK